MRINEGGVDLKTYLGVERRQQPSNQARLGSYKQAAFLFGTEGPVTDAGTP